MRPSGRSTKLDGNPQWLEIMQSIALHGFRGLSGLRVFAERFYLLLQPGP